MDDNIYIYIYIYMCVCVCVCVCVNVCAWIYIYIYILLVCVMVVSVSVFQLLRHEQKVIQAKVHKVWKAQFPSRHFTLLSVNNLLYLTIYRGVSDLFPPMTPASKRNENSLTQSLTSVANSSSKNDNWYPKCEYSVVLFGFMAHQPLFVM